jgi:hypothetical protein
MVTFAAVGDVGPESDDVDSILARVSEELRSADITFCQLELPISTRGSRLPQVSHTARSHPRAAEAMRSSGIDAASWASNHCMDLGEDAFFDTIDALEAEGIVPLGVGANLAEARRIRIIERDGVKVALLAYCTILPSHYWATPKRAGAAPMRALSSFEPIEPDQPGTPVRVRTFPHPDDLAGVIEDVEQARLLADAVIVSMHWGIHFVPAVIAEYQRTVAHAVIDAGADLIVGHHAHILKGVEIYKGRAIFYSLGNFAMELPITEELAANPHFQYLQSLHPGWEPDFGSRFNFPHDSKKTCVVRCDIDASGISNVSFRPAYIDRQAVPEMLEPADPRFAEVVDYVAGISATAGLETRFRVAGRDVFVE